MGNNDVNAAVVEMVSGNWAGGKPKHERRPHEVGEYIVSNNIDVVFSQELAELEYDDGSESVLEEILEEIQRHSGSKYVGYFVAAVDSRRHPAPNVVPGTNKRGRWHSDRVVQPGRSLSYAAQGNGFVINEATWEVRDLWGGPRPASAASVVISAPHLFLGDRESEPRILVLLRVRHRRSGKELILATTHLTVLRPENEELGDGEELGEGELRRRTQVENICRVFEQLPAGLDIVLAGDLNAELHSPELEPLVDAGFTAATSECLPADIARGTHKKKGIFIDHFFYPEGSRLSLQKCFLPPALDDVSDHRPVQCRFSLST